MPATTFIKPSYGDVRSIARVLMLTPPHKRDELANTIVFEATEANAHRLNTGRAHPAYGTGSIMSAALTRKAAPEPFFDDRDYIACVIIALKAIDDALVLAEREAA